MTAEQISAFAADVPANLEGIATCRMAPSDIPEYCKKLVILNNASFNQLHKQQTEKSQHAQDLITDKKLVVAHELAYAVALREDLFGAMHGLGLSPSKKEDIILGNLIRAASALRVNPALFGEKTPQIYEGIRARLKRTRPEALDQMLGAEDYPHFTSETT